MTSKSFSEQLGALFNPQNINRADSFLIKDTDKVSADLHRLYKKEGLSINWAMQCGAALREIKYPTKMNQIVDEFFLKLWLSDHHTIASKLLASAAFASTQERKEKLCRGLARRVINDSFDLLEVYTKEQYDFVVQQAGEELFFATFWEIKYEIDAQQIKLRGKQIKLRGKQNKLQEWLKRNAIRNQIKDSAAKIFQRLTTLSATTDFTGIQLETADIQLIKAWSNSRGVQDNDVASLIKNSANPYETCRLISARIGELAAKTFFKSFYKKNIDVSLQQVSGTATDWKSHDLLMDSIPYDVKNARKPFTSGSHYSEQFVKSWKQFGGGEVQIIGTLSDYKKAEEYVEGDNGTTTVLGKVSQRQIRDAQKWINLTYNGLLDLRLQITDSFLAGWVYEYPRSFYPNRDSQILRSIDQLLTDSINLQSNISDENELLETKKLIPRWFFSFIEREELVTRFVTDQEEFYSWRLIQKIKKEIGISRRAIYLMVVCAVLSKAKEEHTTFSPEVLTDLIIPAEDKRFPLGLFDPQMYIANLLDVLTRMWSLNRNELTKFKKFKLSGSNILQGQTPSGEWRTVIAFCGGWREEPKVKCGKNPLYLGESVNCKSCGKLICSECGHCSEYCTENKKNMTQG